MTPDDSNGCKKCGFRTTDAALESCPTCRTAMVHVLPPVLYPCELCGGTVDTRRSAVVTWAGSTAHDYCVDPSALSSQVTDDAYQLIILGRQESR